MGGVQIENLLNLMEGTVPLNREAARREVLAYLNANMASVARELEEKGEAFIPTSSGSFRLTKEDLIAA